MSSEIIVVLILVALAFVFIVWVRLNSKEHEAPKQVPKPAGDETVNRR